MTQYARGASFERLVVDYFTSRGYVAIRAAGSHGHADICALRADSDPLLIQCKLGRYMPPADRLALLTCAEKAGAVPLLVDRPSRGRIRIRRLMPDGATYDEFPL